MVLRRDGVVQRQAEKRMNRAGPESGTQLVVGRLQGLQRQDLEHQHRMSGGPPPRARPERCSAASRSAGTARSRPAGTGALKRYSGRRQRPMAPSRSKNPADPPCTPIPRHLVLNHVQTSLASGFSRCPTGATSAPDRLGRDEQDPLPRRACWHDQAPRHRQGQRQQGGGGCRRPGGRLRSGSRELEIGHRAR